MIHARLERNSQGHFLHVHALAYQLLTRNETQATGSCSGPESDPLSPPPSRVRMRSCGSKERNPQDPRGSEGGPQSMPCIYIANRERQEASLRRSSCCRTANYYVELMKCQSKLRPYVPATHSLTPWYLCCPTILSLNPESVTASNQSSLIQRAVNPRLTTNTLLHASRALIEPSPFDLVHFYQQLPVGDRVPFRIQQANKPVSTP